MTDKKTEVVGKEAAPKPKPEPKPEPVVKVSGKFAEKSTRSTLDRKP